VRLLHLVTLTRALSGILIVRSRNASAMGSPIEFEASIGSTRDRLPIERLKDVPCSLPIWKLNKAISYSRSFDFISDELHISDCGNIIELLGNVIFIHPRFHVTYPQCLPLLLLLLGTTTLRTSWSGWIVLQGLALIATDGAHAVTWHFHPIGSVKRLRLLHFNFKIITKDS